MLFAAGTVSLNPDILTTLMDWIAGIAAEKGGLLATTGALATSDELLPYGDAIALALLLYNFAVDTSRWITIERKGNEDSELCLKK